MADQRPLSPSEKALWRRYAEGVTPLSEQSSCGQGTAPPRPALPDRPPPRPAGNATPRRGPGKPGPLDRSLRRKLKTGRATVDAVLDLHGFRAAQAEHVLHRFIESGRKNGRRCVLVITGKGRVSDDRPAPASGILRRLVPEWLRRPPSARLVLSFGPAERRHGGDGAFYVVLRSRRDPER